MITLTVKGGNLSMPTKSAPSMSLDGTSREALPAGTKGMPFSPTPWVKLVQQACLHLVDKDKDGRNVTLRMLKVYLILIGRMDVKNIVNECQQDLAETMGMTPQAFSAALRSLEDGGYLLRIGGRDKSRKIMLSPACVAKGQHSTWAGTNEDFGQLQNSKLRGPSCKLEGGEDAVSTTAIDSACPEWSPF